MFLWGSCSNTVFQTRLHCPKLRPHIIGARKKNQCLSIFRCVGGWHICFSRELSVKLNAVACLMLQVLVFLQLSDSALRAQTDRADLLIPRPWKLPFPITFLHSCYLSHNSGVCRVFAAKFGGGGGGTALVGTTSESLKHLPYCKTWNREHLVGRVVHMECVLYVREKHAKQSRHRRKKKSRRKKPRGQVDFQPSTSLCSDITGMCVPGTIYTPITFTSLLARMIGHWNAVCSWQYMDLLCIKSKRNAQKIVFECAKPVGKKQVFVSLKLSAPCYRLSNY